MSMLRTASDARLSFGRTARILVAVLMAAISVLAVQPQAKADSSGGQSIGPIAVAMAAAPAQSMKPGAGMSLVTPVVGRACRSCRRYCYNEYRRGCWDGWCRKAFTSCMRDCWYDVCR